MAADPVSRGRELKVATERRRRRCAFGSKLRHVCWRGGASRPPGAIRVGYRLALASRLCCYGAWRESGCDAEPSRSDRRGSESSLTVHALSSRTEFAFTAVAPLLPTMTTVGSGVTIGSPAISSAGGGRSGLEGPRAPCCRRVEIDMQLDGSPEKVRWFSRRDRQCGGERLDRIRAFRREQCCKRGAVRRSA